jgi:hypothetical protein
MNQKSKFIVKYFYQELQTQKEANVEKISWKFWIFLKIILILLFHDLKDDIRKMYDALNIYLLKHIFKTRYFSIKFNWMIFIEGFLIWIIQSYFINIWIIDRFRIIFEYCQIIQLFNNQSGLKRFFEYNFLIRIELIVSKTCKIFNFNNRIKIFHIIRIIIHRKILTFKLI